MYANNLEQLHSFSIFIIVGIIISLIFDAFRILRKAIKTTDIITYFEDVLFWIITMFIILISIFIFNNGELRLYIFIGMIVGIMFYLMFISKYIIKFGISFLKILNRIINIAFKPFLFMIKILKKIFLKQVSFIFINFRKILSKIKKILIFDKKT